MSFQNLDLLFALSLGMCMTCAGLITTIMVKCYKSIDWDTRVLYLMQIILCCIYIFLEYRWIEMYIDGKIIINSIENLYWIIFESFYFAVSTLLSLKIYTLQHKKVIHEH